MYYLPIFLNFNFLTQDTFLVYLSYLFDTSTQTHTRTSGHYKANIWMYEFNGIFYFYKIYTCEASVFSRSF
jgi:hypothetical protein